MEATAARPGWREESRQDRLVRAQIDLDREAARVQTRIAEREAAARAKLDAAAGRRAARAAAAAARAARLVTLAGWAAARVVELLFVPVIGVPALLSWTAMSSFGARLYGPVGYTLPAFSEGAMWAFAAAVTLTLRRHPGRPVWHLRAGIVVFAAFGAGLNFVHGLTFPPLFPGLPSGPVTGAVMAAVSVAGVTAHQLVTARRGAADIPPAALADIRTEIDAVREALDASVRALRDRHEETAASLDDTIRSVQEAFRTDSGAVREALRTETGAVREALDASVSALHDRHDATAASLDDTIRAVQDAFRAEIEAVRGALPAQAPEADRAPATDRTALVAGLADEIRDAISSGDQWAPDYGALMERTGYRRSWCEKAVRDARTQAFLTPPHDPRTDTSPYGQTARPAPAAA